VITIQVTEQVLLSEKNTEENKVASDNNINEIVIGYSSRLRGFIRKRVSSAEDADDILQDVFYQLAEADNYLKPIDQITSWLYTVARNKITDWYRKKREEPLLEISGDDETDSILAEIGELMFDNGSTPETEYLRSLIWLELDDALTFLPEEQRIVFEMTEMKGLSFKELSNQTGVSVNTLLSRKRYAVLYLRKRLQVLYDELLNF
jgi:RNA polymerase sigma factor (sigma-70 family)